MHLSRTDLNLFVVFEAIYSQGGVTRAAETLNLTQPTISHALARLRDRVGDPLFVRYGQKLQPTPVAHKMIAPVREALRLFESTLGELDGFDPASAQMNFSVGMRSLMENTFFMPLVLLLQEHAPGVTVASSQYERRALESDLLSGAMNAAIDVFLPLPEQVKRKHMVSAPSVVVARRGHPIVTGELALDDYVGLQHIVVTSRAEGAGPEDVALSREGRSRHITVRCQQINTAMRLVSASDLVLTMAENFAKRANIWFDNQIVPAPFSSPRVDTYLYWHENMEADPSNRWFRRMIEMTIAETIPPPH